MSSHNTWTQVRNMKKDGGLLKLRGSGAPSDGLAGYAIGCEYTNTANGKIYVNTGTTASTTWTVVGSQS